MINWLPVETTPDDLNEVLGHKGVQTVTYTVDLSPEELRILIRALEERLFDLVGDGAEASEMKQVLNRIDELKAVK